MCVCSVCVTRDDAWHTCAQFSKLIMANHANELLKLHRVKPANPRPRTPRRATTPRGSGRPSGQVAARPARAASARAPKTTKAAAADHYVPMDHALEMWREGYAMGDGHRGNVDGLLTGCTRGPGSNTLQTRVLSSCSRVPVHAQSA